MCKFKVGESLKISMTNELGYYTFIVKLKSKKQCSIYEKMEQSEEIKVS